MKNVLGIAVARKGSKRLPGKNIRPLAGKPMISWTFQAARESQLLTRALISTDDEDIRKLALSEGLEAPFLRPPHLANDTASAVDVLIHAIDWLKENEGYTPEAVMLLQPTSPLRQASDIDGSIRLFEEKNADTVVGICPAWHHPLWMKKVESDGTVSNWLDQQNVPYRKQELPEAYALNGAIYLAKTTVLKEKETLYGEKVYPWIMPMERSLDVDTPWDFRLVDFLLREEAAAPLS